MNYSVLLKQLELHEGLRLKPYTDTVGKLTIGIGRNLSDVGIAESEARYLLNRDIGNATAQLNKRLPWWINLSAVRQNVLIDMCFNLGINGLLSFKNTLRLIQEGDYDSAANNMLKSKWARQVGQRAKRLSEMMRTDKFPIELELKESNEKSRTSNSIL